MTREEIRRENARQLSIEVGGPAAFGRKIEMSDSQVSQIIGKTPTKNIGNLVAQRIEDSFKKPRGWLDIPHISYASAAETQGINEASSSEERRVENGDRRSHDENEIEIPQYKGIGGSMGSGLILKDQPGEIQGWRVTPEWIQKNVPAHTGIQNLCIVTGFGPSMRPLFNPGDPLLVDRGVTKADEDAVYFFRVGDEGFIKHLQRVPGVGLVAISENKIYRDWTITGDMDFEVFAKVIKVWHGTEV